MREGTRRKIKHRIKAKINWAIILKINCTNRRLNRGPGTNCNFRSTNYSPSRVYVYLGPRIIVFFA